MKVAPALQALSVLPAQIDSARTVLCGKPEGILKWLEIWAHDNAPIYHNYLEKVHEEELEKSLHRKPDESTWDVQSEVFY